MVEGGKELLWVAIKKVFAKERLLVCENGSFWRTVVKGDLEGAAEGGKELFWVGIRKGLCERNAFGLQKSWRFLLMQSYPIKKKLFLSALQQPLRTVPKLTCSNPF